MLHKKRHLPLAEFAIKMNAPVEHMFGSHEWCDKEWCCAKQVEETKIEIGNKILQHNNDETIVDEINKVSNYVKLYVYLCYFI